MLDYKKRCGEKLRKSEREIWERRDQVCINSRWPTQMRRMNEDGGAFPQIKWPPWANWTLTLWKCCLHGGNAFQIPSRRLTNETGVESLFKLGASCIWHPTRMTWDAWSNFSISLSTWSCSLRGDRQDPLCGLFAIKVTGHQGQFFLYLSWHRVQCSPKSKKK